MMSIRRLIYFFVAIIASTAMADAVTLRVEAPSQVIEGQKFNVKYCVDNPNDSPSEPKLSDLPNCKLIFGPGRSTESSYSNFNGKTSQRTTIGFVYTYKAIKAGKVTIPSAKVIVGGKTLSTKPLALEILPPDRSASSAPNSSVQAYDINTQTTDRPVGGDELFIRIQMSKPSVYEQEGVVCSIKLYSKYQVQKLVTNVQPAYNGFLADEVQLPLQGHFESVGGENFYCYEIKRSVLIPQQTGHLEINSGSYDVTIVQFETIRTGFGLMRSPVEKTVKVNSNKGTLNVIPLPAPKPADFCGAVGRFSVTRQLVSNKGVRTNEAATIKLTISGYGNLKSLTAPKFDFPTQFDLYDAQTVVTANPSGDSLDGKVEVDYTFVPQSVGKFTVGGARFVYFDLDSKEYKTIVVDGFNLDVAKGAASNVVKYNNEMMKDILPLIATPFVVELCYESIFGEMMQWLFYVVVTLAFVVVAFVYRKRLKDRANITLMRRKGANKVARRRLKRAKRCLQKKLKDKFYEETLTALWGYFGDKLSIPVSELNRDNISGNMLDYGVESMVVTDIINLIDDCEFARYAQSAEISLSMDDVYARACELINKVENTKRKKIEQPSNNDFQE